MTETRYSYDERCEDLAEIFLASEQPAIRARVRDLAQRIQEAIEDFIQDERIAEEEKAEQKGKENE